MTERWEYELAKLDRLEPSDDLGSRVGQMPLHEDRPRTRQRVVVIVASFAIFLAAGAFAFRAFNMAEPPIPLVPSEDVGPDVVRVVCDQGGTEATPDAVVTEEGVRFEVDNRSGVDEVIINGTSGEASAHGADIDLSSATKHTFQIPPGDYAVGCFHDDEVDGADGGEGWDRLPGMVSVHVTDPDGIYISPELTCTVSERTSSDDRVITSLDRPTPEEVIRSAIEGLEADDVIEPTGYPVATGLAALGGDGPQAYRIVRAGQVIGSLWLSFVALDQGFFASLDLQACADPGLTVREQGKDEPASPTPASSGLGISDGAGVAIQVFNGTSIAGLASSVQQELESSGYVAVADAANASSTEVATTVVYFRGGDGAVEGERLATELAKQLAVNADVQPMPAEFDVAASRDAILVVVLGTDYPIR